MENRTTAYKGKKLFYRVAGEGPVVVLLHGFGEDGTVWKGQYDAFPDHQLVIPDLPGSGGSEMIEDMSMEGMAEALYYLLTSGHPPILRQPAEGVAEQSLTAEQRANEVGSLQSGPLSADPFPLGRKVGIGAGPEDEVQQAKVSIVGHSMGGYVALAFAEKYPHRLRSFGLFHSTAFADSTEKKETRRKGILFIQQYGAEAFLKTTIPNLFASQSKEANPGMMEEALAVGKTFGKEALIEYYEAMMARPDRTDVLRKAEVPVLFVMGRHDTAVPIEDVLKQCHLPAVADVHILERSGHMGMVEELAEANKILSQFASLEKPFDS